MVKSCLREGFSDAVNLLLSNPTTQSVMIDCSHWILSGCFNETRDDYCPVWLLQWLAEHRRWQVKSLHCASNLLWLRMKKWKTFIHMFDFVFCWLLRSCPMWYGMKWKNTTDLELTLFNMTRIHTDFSLLAEILSSEFGILMIKRLVLVCDRLEVYIHVVCTTYKCCPMTGFGSTGVLRTGYKRRAIWSLYLFFVYDRIQILWF